MGKVWTIECDRCSRVFVPNEVNAEANLGSESDPAWVPCIMTHEIPQTAAHRHKVCSPMEQWYILGDVSWDGPWESKQDAELRATEDDVIVRVSEEYKVSKSLVQTYPTNLG